MHPVAPLVVETIRTPIHLSYARSAKKPLSRGGPCPIVPSGDEAHGRIPPEPVWAIERLYNGIARRTIPKSR
jgi:hypothetical protein